MTDPIEPINPSPEDDAADAHGQAAMEARSFRGDLVKTFGGKKSTLIAAGVVGFVVIAVIASQLEKKPAPPPAKLMDAPEMASTQGSQPLTPAYQADVQQTNAANAQAALQTGGTSIATPIMPAPPPAEPDTSGASQPQSAPVVEFANAQSDMPAAAKSQNTANGNSGAENAGSTSNADTVTTTQVGYNKDTEQAMMDAMKGLAKPDISGPSTVVASYNTMQGQGSTQNSPAQQAGFTSGNTGSGPSGSGTNIGGSQTQQNQGSKLVPAAGTILYARMIGELNSDAPGPALATIVQGPLAGARIIGQFQTARAGLVIKFSTMTVPALDGSGTITTPINAIAVSASSLTSGMATSINDHMLSNLAVTFVAGFAQGFGQVLSQSGSTTTTTGTGLAIISNPALTLPKELAAAGGTAAGAAGGLFQQLYGNRPPTIKLAAGTPFALVFMGNSSGVTDAQSPVQSVDQPGSSNSNTQKFTPTLPARSDFGTSPYGAVGGN